MEIYFYVNGKFLKPEAIWLGRWALWEIQVLIPMRSQVELGNAFLGDIYIVLLFEAGFLCVALAVLELTL